ncbi:MAG TPA: hypothetical protein VE175_00750 [Woeseiaceae bacterium]|jgi:hypothetical protein|nr:hypothetical protein [Woeseiaceae bacterium]
MNTRVSASGACRSRRWNRSTSAWAAVLIVVLAVSGPGCSTTRDLHPQTAAPQNALAGVPVTAVMNDGRRIEMKVVESSTEYLTGTDSSGNTHLLRVQDIQSLEVSRVSAGRTGLLVLGIAATITVLAFLAYTTSSYAAVTL